MSSERLQNRVRPSVRSNFADQFSGEYRQSTAGLLTRSRVLRFGFLVVFAATVIGLAVYLAGCLDMSYNSYPNDLYSAFKWWFHVINALAVGGAIVVSVAYMIQGGRWTRRFAIVGTLAATGWLLFGMAVVGKIWCECGNIGPGGLLHPECPQIASSDPRLAFVIRGWTHLGMLLAVGITAAILLAVINNVGQLVAQIEFADKFSREEFTEGLIGVGIAENETDAAKNPHLISVYSSPMHVFAIASSIVNSISSDRDLESSKPLTYTDGYVLNRPAAKGE